MRASQRTETPRRWTPFDLWSDLYQDGMRRADAAISGAAELAPVATATRQATSGTADVVRQVSDGWFRVVRASTELAGAVVDATRRRLP